jgi:DNA-binding IclR family transcriptional regulator
MKSRSCSPSAVRTTWSSQTFSLSVLPMTIVLLLIPGFRRICHAALVQISASGKLIFALAFQHPRRQYQDMDNSSGVGVLDKAALVLSALETGPTTLAGLVAATGLARPTAHRLAVALEHHRLVSRDLQGRFILGPRLGELASAAGEDRLLATAGPVLARLRDITGESAQMFRRQGDYRVCVATAERMSGLRDSVPVGTQLTMNAGSAAQVLLAWEEPDRMQRGLRGSRYSAVALAAVRRRGWAHSVGEREPGVASVSAPVRSPSGKVIAAVSVSGPIERLSRQPGRLHAPAVIAAAERLSEVLRRSGRE